MTEPKEGSDKKGIWREVGAVWPPKNGSGFDLVIIDQLSVSGRIVCTERKEGRRAGRGVGNRRPRWHTPAGFSPRTPGKLLQPDAAQQVETAESKHHEDPTPEQGGVDAAAQPSAERHSELDGDYCHGGNQ